MLVVTSGADFIAVQSYNVDDGNWVSWHAGYSSETRDSINMKLSGKNLGAIGIKLAVPAYRRSSLTAGILHFGVGNFHRAHQGTYLDDLFHTGRDLDWAIIGAGVFPAENRIRDVLAEQDYLTTIVEQEAGRSSARIIGPMIDFLPPGNATEIIAKLADPAIRIVSLTITEGGYFIDPASGAFNPVSPEIVVDAQNPEQPKTVFGMIAAGLKRRREQGIPPFAIMSCDNIPHNGMVTHNAVVGFAGLYDPGFADWISGNVTFPSSMLDRITPATGDREREILKTQFGVEDGWPVFCEPFKQWVLEDNFPSGRPMLETVGVQFVPDVIPYETMKIRILNGGHAAIAYPAGLMDIHFVHEAMEHPLIRSFLDKIEREEIIPVVPPVPNMDLEAYYQQVAERFANPKIGDTVRRLCLDGSNRQPKFIVPSIADRLETNSDVSGLALLSAMWCRYCYGRSDSGKPIEPNDPSWPRLQKLACEAKDDHLAWLKMEDVYGNIAHSEKFRSAFAIALHGLWSDGTRATLQRYIDNSILRTK